MDLLDLYRGKLSLRRANVLIKRLLRMPGRSALLSAIDERADWDTRDYLTANLVDELALANWLFIKANFKKAPPEPKPTPRPGVHQNEKKTAPQGQDFASPQEVADIFAALQF